jgi:hypothetical protein
MDSYPGRPSPPSPLNGGLTLSTIGPSAHNFGPSHPPSDRSELYRAHHKGRRCCLMRPDSPRIVPDHPIHSRTVRLHRSDHSEHQKSPVIRLVRKEYSQSPKPQEPKKSPVTKLVWPTKVKLSVRSHPHSTQKEKVKFTFNITKCDKIFDELLKYGNIELSHNSFG